MAFDAKTQRLITLKKLSGKAHTSNDKGLANEALPSGVTVAAESVFKDVIPKAPDGTSLYTITSDTVEFLRLSASYIAGTDTADGRHGFELTLPDDYEATSTNPDAGTDPWINGKIINVTSGAIQVVPPSFATDYEAKIYHTGSGETRIPVLDARDWSLDYFNGIFFQQDPPGTGDDSANPRYVDAFVYIGDFMDSVVAGGGSGDADAQYLVLASTGSLSAERVLTAGTGISSTDAGAGSSLTLNIDDNVVATVSGSTFTGAVNFSAGLSGSVTHLTDGSSFLLAGPNMVITTGSNGAVTLEAGNVTTVSADTATRTKRTYDLTSGVAADTNYALTQIDLSDAGHDPSYIDVLVNGALLHSGTAAQVTSGDADYSVINDTTLRFAFDLQAADIIDVALITSGAGAADASAPYVTFEASGDLTNERILTAGAGLAVSTAASGEIAMSIDRIKTVYTVTGSQHQSGIPLTVANAAFDSGSYDEHRIDLFVNGQFMVSGSNSDYTLHGNADGVIFNFNLFQNDKVVSIVQ